MSFIDDALIEFDAKDALAKTIMSVHRYVKCLENSHINADDLNEFVEEHNEDFLPSCVDDVLDDKTDKRLYAYYVYDKFLPFIKKVMK